MSDRARLHLTGVEGSGMPSLALLLHEPGPTVTGSDSFCPAPRLAILEGRGITVRQGGHPDLVRSADCLVASPAIPKTDLERRVERRDGIPVKSRARMLADLVAGRPSVCVAGSHGMSTGTAMLVRVLETAGREDAGTMLGGGVSLANPEAAPPARLGAPDAPFVAQACEAHGALACCQPFHAVLTSLDDDHADHQGGVAGLRRAFAAFLSRLPQEGRAVACGDDPEIRDFLPGVPCAALTWGLGAGNALKAVPQGPGRAAVLLQGKDLGRLLLAVPGRHTLLNALAAVSTALALVAAQAARQPTAPAVDMAHRRPSHAELALRSGRLAASLAAAGARAGDGVGVCLGRTVDRLAAFLAILDCDAVFVPLDPARPEEDLRFVNCGAVPDQDRVP